MSKQYADCMVQIAIYVVCDYIYFCVLQLAGTAVLAIGLWLRLDQKTKGLFEEPDSSYVFYTGKMQGCLLYHSYLYKSYLFFSVYHMMCCVCVGVYILIAAGALIMVVGFLGCCGAIRESPCMLGMVCTT